MILQTRVMVFLGMISYGIYLWHDGWIERYLHWTGVPGWWAMMEFLAELAIGLVYAWKIGALDWE